MLYQFKSTDSSQSIPYDPFHAITHLIDLILSSNSDESTTTTTTTTTKLLLLEGVEVVVVVGSHFPAK